MIRNYLLIALRNFQRQKLLAFLNMFGLALGLACAILIFLYVSDELQYDTMHPHYKDTYYIGYPTSLHHKAKDKIILTEEIKWMEPDFDKIIAFDLIKGNQEKMFENQ